MLVECGFFSNPGEPTANTTDSSASPDLPATMQMPLFRIREQSPRSPLPPTTGEGFFMPARHTSDCKTLFPKRISMSCSLSCSFIKTKTASVLFQTLAVVLKWWRRHYFFIVPKMKNRAFPMVFCVFNVAKMNQTHYKCTAVCTAVLLWHHYSKRGTRDSEKT